MINIVRFENIILNNMSDNLIDKNVFIKPYSITFYNIIYDLLITEINEQENDLYRCINSKIFEF
jgi:hypothetical protein